MSALGVKKIVQYGLSEVYASKDPQVDIVLVHGLNGHPHQTWATHKPDCFWPSDILPSALEDQSCRILTYGYDANVTAFTDGTSKDKIHNHAEHLASRLVANRSLKKAIERPIIFVCHSLGGLVVKRCLVHCNNVTHAHTERLRSIYVSTYGILFLGTPHNGSDLAKWGTLLQSICAAVLPKKFFDSSPQLIEDLKTNNETLQNINRLFIPLIRRYHIYFFHESKPTDLKGTLDYVVDEHSAAPDIDGVERMGIERDHSHMCKFEDESAPGYVEVAEAIQRYAEAAPRLIKARWNEEKQVREFQRQNAARELMGDNMYQMMENVSPVTADRGTQGNLENPRKQIESVPVPKGPLVIAPQGFRPNSVFLGFQFELDSLATKLKRKRDIGSSAVLVWGPPGCGKTHLARQHFWQNGHQYPGGRFWIDCKSWAAIYRCFWDIGQGAALLGADDHRNPDWDAAPTFLDSVRKWLAERKDWLLVFDGVSFDSEEDILAFVKFIPDSEGTSIIYTSTDRTLAKRQRLLYPGDVKVSPLTQDEARALLYKGLDIRHPTAMQHDKATQLVKHYECLPLAIHAAAHMLVATGKPLEKYAPGLTNKRLAEPFIEIMEALYQHSHFEATNLINLLSFFNHNVPVTLLAFGGRALNSYNLEIRSSEREGGVKRDLDNTIAVLIKYGLAERTLQPYVLDSSLSAEPSIRLLTGDSSPEMLRQSIEEDATSPTQLPRSHEHSNGGDQDTEETTDSRPQSSLAGRKAVAYSIDILRVHTVVQGFCRDEMRLKDKQKYWWWLTVATQLFCLSYATAHDIIMASEGRGLVRDYREFQTQGSQIYAHFPRKRSRNTPESLQKARHELRVAMRSISREIESRSPSHSFDSVRHRMQISIFERAPSTSDDSASPHSRLSRSSTWSFGEYSEHSKTESPVESHGRGYHDPDADPEHFDSDDSWDEHMEFGLHDSPQSSVVTTRRSSKSEATETDAPSSIPETTTERRSSFLQSIFKGRPIVNKKHKDLGEWKPLPAPPTLSIAGASGQPSRPASADDLRPEDVRQPLRIRSPNIRLSPLAAEFAPSRKDSLSPPQDASESHSEQSSPRLAQLALAKAAVALNSKSLPPLAVEEDVTLIRRIVPQFVQNRWPQLSSHYNTHPGLVNQPFPTGYTSTPMSRNTSRESNQSLATAPPAVPGTASLSASPNIVEPYMYSRPGPASIDIVAANTLDFGRAGEWADMTPVTPSAPPMSRDGSQQQQPLQPGAVQFGGMDPIMIEEARLRAEEYSKLGKMEPDFAKIRQGKKKGKERQKENLELR